MRKLYINVIIVSLILLGLLLPLMSPIPTYAAKPKDKAVETEVLGYGEIRVDPYTKIKLKEIKKDKDKYIGIWEATFTSLPETLLDLKTKITVEWRGGWSDDGVVYYENGNNLFYARITGTRVSVEYKGKLAAWDPVLYLGDTQLSLTGGPKLVTDPYPDTNYGANTIEWVYEKPGGMFSSSFRILRYVRQIEGQLQEFYVLESNPGQSLRIRNNYEEESGFIGASILYAYDSGYRSVGVSGNALEKFVDFRELNRPELEYPVVIDPTSVFTSTYNVYQLQQGGSTYSTVRTSTTGYSNAYTYIGVGQDTATQYNIYRAPLYFDTSALPDGSTISSAYISLRGQYDYSDTDFYLTVQTGSSGHPARPPLGSDYNCAYYSDNGGTLTSSGWSISDYNNLYLSSTGRGWISLTSWTSFMLRSSRDIGNNIPTGYEYVGWRSNSYGSGSEPKLTVTYTSPITIPSISTWSAQNIGSTSATLRGYLSSDGGADCSVWFDYGTTTSYGIGTQPYGGYNTGESFSAPVSGLLPGTLYHYTAGARNSAGNSTSDDETFLTLPNKPSSFTVTPGNIQNVLSWTKGTGSTHTMVRRGTGGYPTSTASGTEVYFDTGTGTTDTPLTNGMTYYYSAWGYTSSGGLTQYSSTYAQGSGTPYTTEAPTTTTYAATNVGTTTATFNGYLNSLGGDTDTDVYFQYYWGAGTWTDNQGAADPPTLTEPRSFSFAATSLPASTLIHVRAKAVNTYGTGNGTDMPFTTGAACAPTITTVNSGGIQGTSATLYGKVTDDGGLPGGVTIDFQWGLSSAYGLDTGDGTGFSTDDTFQVTLTGLEPDTTYYFRARGWNSVDTGYGVGMNFTTLSPSNPDVETLSATNVGSSSVLLHGQLTDDGDVDCDTRFTWSDNVTLSVNITSSGWQTGKRTSDTFEYFSTGLTYDTVYYFRAEASNTPGVVINGTILIFTTVFTAPGNFVATPLTSTSIALSWIPQSDKTLIVARTGSYPADRLDGLQVYFGPEASTTYEGLVPGVTYFFRAWSWRDGDNYSGTYAEDAATTPSVGGISEIVTPYDSANTTMPGAPTQWWQGPGSSKIQKWPLVSYIDSVADGMGMDRGSMWAIFAGLASVLVGMVGALLIPLRFAGFGAGLLGVLVLVGVGVLAGWILAFYFIVGLALLILLPAGQGG